MKAMKYFWHWAQNNNVNTQFAHRRSQKQRRKLKRCVGK